MKNSLMSLLFVFSIMSCNLSEEVLFQEIPDTFPGKWMSLNQKTSET
ncbi:MAG: hypothetical protein WD426_12820 [Anditalea sp.]